MVAQYIWEDGKQASRKLNQFIIRALKKQWGSQKHSWPCYIFGIGSPSPSIAGGVPYNQRYSKMYKH